jgi:hypothetical protein
MIHALVFAARLYKTRKSRTRRTVVCNIIIVFVERWVLLEQNSPVIFYKQLNNGNII